MKKQITIEEKLTNMEDLVIAQDKALKTADQLLLLKDCMIDILEEQKRIQAKQIKVLGYCIIAIISLHFISLAISYYNAS